MISTSIEYHQSSQAEGELLIKPSEVFTSFMCHCLKRPSKSSNPSTHFSIAHAAKIHFNITTERRERQGWQKVMLENLYRAGCNSTARQTLLQGIRMILVQIGHSKIPFQ